MGRLLGGPRWPTCCSSSWPELLRLLQPVAPERWAASRSGRVERCALVFHFVGSTSARVARFGLGFSIRRHCARAMPVRWGSSRSSISAPRPGRRRRERRRRPTATGGCCCSSCACWPPSDPSGWFWLFFALLIFFFKVKQQPSRSQRDRIRLIDWMGSRVTQVVEVVEAKSPASEKIPNFGYWKRVPSVGPPLFAIRKELPRMRSGESEAKNSNEISRTKFRWQCEIVHLFEFKECVGKVKYFPIPSCWLHNTMKEEWMESNWIFIGEQWHRRWRFLILNLFAESQDLSWLPIISTKPIARNRFSDSCDFARQLHRCYQIKPRWHWIMAWNRKQSVEDGFYVVFFQVSRWILD